MWDAVELPLSGRAVVELLQHILSKGAAFRFTNKGSSMSPFIKHGDVVTASALRGSLPRCGHVVAFVHPGRESVFIRMVVGKRADSYLVKDDNVPGAGDLIPKANILGRVTRVERKGKRVFLGFGPERVLIAFLSHRGLLLPLPTLVRRLVHLIEKRRDRGEW